VWGGIGALAVALLAWAWMPRPVPVDLARAERGPMAVTLDEEGETRVRERYVVSAPFAGRVLRIDLEPGDPVLAGTTVLATFLPADPVPLDARTRAEATARVRAAETALEGARAVRREAAAELDLARAELDRLRALAEQDIVARQELERADAGAEVAAERLAGAEAAVRTARFELDEARATLGEEGTPGPAAPIALRSPVDGVVLRRLRESEAVVPAGEPLVEVGDPAALEVVADYLSTDAVRIAPGQPARIVRWGGEGALAGVVQRVEPAGFTKISALGVEEQRVNVWVDFEDPREAWEALGDGYRVEVQVVVWAEDDVLRVPSSALFRVGDGWAVWRVEGGRVERREVRVGADNGLEARILDGLAAGDVVVAHPGDAVEPGVRVEARQS